MHKAKNHSHEVNRSGITVGLTLGKSLTPRPDDYILGKEETLGITKRPKLGLQPMSELDLMIENGYGDTPQYRLPADWRTRKKGQ